MPSIYISPSTQEHNIGANNYGSEEKNMNDIADILIPILNYNGITTYRNKKENVYWQHKDEANTLPIDAYLAIHSNAFNGQARGAVTFYNPYNSESERFAQIVGKNINAITPTDDYGVWATYDLTEVVAVNAPAVLVEVAFHDNQEDAAWIMDNKQLIAERLASAVCEYFGIEMKLPNQQDQKKTIYRVQLGAFTVRENAERLKDELVSKGYQAFVTTAQI